MGVPASSITMSISQAWQHKFMKLVSGSLRQDGLEFEASLGIKRDPVSEMYIPNQTNQINYNIALLLLVKVRKGPGQSSSST